jgi:hypothetical protein
MVEESPEFSAREHILKVGAYYARTVKAHPELNFPQGAELAPAKEDVKATPQGNQPETRSRLACIAPSLD